MSTDNIGLAKLSEGLELVRVGKPQRPEIAAWRYGGQFGRRRRRGFVTAGLLAVGGGTVLAGGAALGMALHEEQERRAMEGELAELEAAWREEEEIGAIADTLLLPE